MRDPSRIPTHHGVFHFRERQYACACVRACTLNVKSPHTSAVARSCVHLSTFVSIACEKRRVERSDRSLQRVVQILSDRSRRIRRTALLPFPCAKRFISCWNCWSIAPRVLRFYKIAFETRNGAASRKDLSLCWMKFKISRRKVIRERWCNFQKIVTLIHIYMSQNWKR